MDVPETLLFFCMVATVVNASLVKRGAYKRHKQELDSMYALGEPQPERAAKLEAGLRDPRPGRTHWTVILSMCALYLLSLTLSTGISVKDPRGRKSRVLSLFHLPMFSIIHVQLTEQTTYRRLSKHDERRNSFTCTIYVYNAG